MKGGPAGTLQTGRALQTGRNRDEEGFRQLLSERLGINLDSEQAAVFRVQGYSV
jgi:hypothetical protein